MTPEAFTEQLKAACGLRLQSVVLFGSAVSGDHAGRRSDYNLLLVLDRLGLDTLKHLAVPTRAWVKAGNSVPLLFSPDTLAQSADVFAIEFADLKDAHRVLFGADVIAPLDIDLAALRHELEHDLQGKLMQLRAEYLLTRGRPQHVVNLMIASLSSFLVLFRASLRLYQPTVPAKKLDALAELAKHTPVNIAVFEVVQRLKAGRRVREVVADTLFAEYLQEIERIVDAVDAVLHPNTR